MPFGVISERAVIAHNTVFFQIRNNHLTHFFVHEGVNEGINGCRPWYTVYTSL